MEPRTFTRATAPAAAPYAAAGSGRCRPTIGWQVGAVSLLCGVLLGIPTAANGHELADGEIERWCEVVVRDDQIQLRYSIGFNPTTEKQVREALVPYLPAAPAVGAAAAEGAHAAEQQRWLAALTAYLTAHLDFEANGMRCEPVASVVRPAGRHPMCWTVEFTFAPPAAGTACRLDCTDTSFPAFPGTARQALRSKSKWVVRESELASLLVRTKPLTWPTATVETAPNRPGARWTVLLAQ